MTQSRSITAASKAIIAQLAEPPRVASLNPIAARFIYSLRLIAVHERAKRDPVPELASRLGSIDIAAKSLALSQVICRSWPENIHVSRFCCGLLSHDEATIAAMIENTHRRDQAGFDDAISGLIRPERVHRLHEAVQELVTAELSAV